MHLINYPLAMPDIRLIPALSQIPARDWDALHDGSNPFISHAFLSGLEHTGCIRPSWGWTPHHLTLWQGETLIAAAPGYLKDNSHGEFVFDQAWAHVYARHGQPYYPKWLCASPYSPVTGPRLLAGNDQHRLLLLQAICELVETENLSSAHINFPLPSEDAQFPVHWLSRTDLQYHWRNPGTWRTFDDYLAAMNHKHRKNIRQERAKLRRSKLELRTFHGDEACPAILEAMHGFYLKTFDDYGNSPALTSDFIRHLAHAMPRNLVIFMAFADDKPLSGALCLRGADTLYGRYWGGENLPGLHFETCYYQGIEYCLHEGLSRFEPGAQGMHKIARGFLPTRVYSRHWIADSDFHQPLAQWCALQREATDDLAQNLIPRSPYRDCSAN